MGAVVAAMNDRKVALERRTSLEVTGPAWHLRQVFNNVFRFHEASCCETEEPMGSRQRLHIEVYESDVGYEQASSAQAISARELSSKKVTPERHVMFRPSAL